MTYQLNVLSQAEEELAELILWYESQREGLGEELLRDVQEVFDTIVKNPRAFQLRYRDVRLLSATRFPLIIHYTSTDSTVMVVKVSHNKRDVPDLR
jgi:plasmid stabilization system protein ParE